MKNYFKRNQHAAQKLTVTQDPDKYQILGFLTCFVICLVAIAGFSHALFNHPVDPLQDVDITIFALVAFSLAALFLIGWSIRISLNRNRNNKIFTIEGECIQCSDGYTGLWREPIQNYQHLRWHKEQRSYVNKYGRQFYTVQVITLDHPQAERCFEIIAHQDASRLKAPCERWAAALDLPVVRC